jgi:hypothetical protein
LEVSPYACQLREIWFGGERVVPVAFLYCNGHAKPDDGPMNHASRFE